jgi:hypothetical protein
LGGIILKTGGVGWGTGADVIKELALVEEVMEGMEGVEILIFSKSIN